MAKRTPSAYFLQRLEEIKAENELKRLALGRRRGVVKEKTRHGKIIYYYRPNGGRRIRLPDPETVGDVAFNQAYIDAVNGKTPAVSGPVRSLPPYSLEIGKPGFVYFLRMGNAVKIGFATSVKKRMRAIQTACPEPTEIVKIIPGSDQTERYFHAHFKSYRQNGEWFRLEGELAAFLAVRA